MSALRPQTQKKTINLRDKLETIQRLIFKILGSPLGLMLSSFTRRDKIDLKESLPSLGAGSLTRKAVGTSELLEDSGEPVPDFRVHAPFK